MNTRETAGQKVPGIRVLELEAFRWFGADHLGRRRHQPPTRSLPRAGAARSSCGRSIREMRRSIKLRLRAAALRRRLLAAATARRAAGTDPQVSAPAPAAGSATAAQCAGTRGKFVRSLICGSTTAYLASGLSAGRPAPGDRLACRLPRAAASWAQCCRHVTRALGRPRSSRTARVVSESSSGVGA